MNDIVNNVFYSMRTLLGHADGLIYFLLFAYVCKSFIGLFNRNMR